MIMAMPGDEIHFEIPASRDELLSALTGADRQITALWNRLSADEFFSDPPGGGWSPAGNLVHLVGAVAPVTLALRLPRLVLGTIFGTARHGSRGFVEMRDAYQRKLREGGTAGRFAPRRRPPPAHPTAARLTLIRRWEKVVPALCQALARWDEAALDLYRLPHPLLGRLTMREMLNFSLYHLGHHANIVAARLPPRHEATHSP